MEIIMSRKNEPSILVPVCDLGGFGDLIAAYNLIQSFKDKGLPVTIGFKGDETKKKFTSLSRDSLDDNLLRSHPKHGPVLTVHPVSDHGPNKWAEQSIGEIHVLEYDKNPAQRYVSSCSKGQLVVDTGFDFDSERGNPQAGIYLQQNLESLLQEVDEASETPDGILLLRKKALEEVLGKTMATKAGGELEELRGDIPDDLLEGKWSIYYPSIIDSRHTFFELLGKAKAHLQEPLTVFCMTATEYEQKKIENSCQEYGLTYVDYSNNREPGAGGHIKVIELGTIPQHQFQTLVSLADTLSLVTGDQSLSQMLQKSMSQNPVPFLYELASWKDNLFENLCRHMGTPSEDAVIMLKSYVHHQGKGTFDKAQILAMTPEEMAALFYDDAAIEGFTKGLFGIRDSFIQERQEAGVVEAERLWSVTDTVSYVAQRALNGMDMYEAVEPLLTPKGREYAAEER